jgi:hypothetical protein
VRGHPCGVTFAHTGVADAVAPRQSGRGARTARYEIRIAGLVGDELAPYVGDPTSVVLPVETVLQGEITDQCALHGMLDRVHSLGLELIEVRCLETADHE